MSMLRRAARRRAKGEPADGRSTAWRPCTALRTLHGTADTAQHCGHCMALRTLSLCYEQRGLLSPTLPLSRLCLSPTLSLSRLASRPPCLSAGSASRPPCLSAGLSLPLLRSPLLGAVCRAHGHVSPLSRLASASRSPLPLC